MGDGVGAGAFLEALALPTEARARSERPTDGGSECLVALYRVETALRRDGVTRYSCRTLLDALDALGWQAGSTSTAPLGAPLPQLHSHGGLAATRAQ